jgi:hypothetical protein
MKNLKIRTILPSVRRTLPNNRIVPQKSTNNLMNEIYYDIDWWDKKFALEWWSNNGHFNEELYFNILLAKLNNINQQPKRGQDITP